MSNRGMDLTKICKMFDTEAIEDVRKIAIYVRESSKQQANEGYNIHTQVEKCKHYAEYVLEEKSDQIVLYTEKGYSAKTVDRPVMNKLIDDIKSGKIKTLIVQKLDRLARRNIGMSVLLELFQEYDIRLITLRENIDTSNNMWKMFVNFYIMLAEIEQDQISERTVEALTYGAEHGSYVKGGKTPFGVARERIYREDGSHIIALKKHPWEWNVLEKIYDMSYHGANCSEISCTVSSLQIMRDHDISLCENQIENILSNKIYMGIMEFGGKEYKIDFIDCLSETYWNQVQNNRKIHLKNTKNDYLYHGKIFCDCGTLCVVDVTNKRLNNGTIKKYKYYVCPHCGKRISENLIYEQIEPKIRKHFELIENENYKERQREKIFRLIELKNDMHNLYINGKIDKKMYIEQLQRSQQTIKIVSKRIKKHKRNYDKLDSIERTEWMNDAIKAIKVDMKTKQVNIQLRT